MSTPPPVPPDDSHIPPVPPIPPAYPQQPAPPQQTAPSNYPPVISPQSSPGAGTKALLFGCGGLLLVALIFGGLAVGWIWKKGKAIAENPQQFIAETVIKSNPDLDFIRSDRNSGTITFRDKKSGEETTANFEDIKNGRFKLTKADGSQVEITPEGIQSVDKDGNKTTVGNGADVVPPPDWVPVFPGASTGIMSSRMEKDGTVEGNFMFGTKQSVSEAEAAYSVLLKDAGFGKFEKGAGSVSGLRSATVKASKEAANGLVQTISAVISSTDQQTVVQLNYQEKPAE